MSNSRKEMIRRYKEMKTEAGVYQIKNTANGKALIAATPNLKTMEGKRFQLQMGSHKNALLQAEWKEFGEKNFVFEVLEVLQDVEDISRDRELKNLEEKWLEELKPYGDRGYNPEPKA
jgi:hypothetical protein